MEGAAVEAAPAKSRRQRKRELRESIALATDPRRVGQAAALPVVRSQNLKVRRLDLWSVFKVSICFYLTGLIVTLLAGVLLWLVADALGYVHNIEKFIGDLLSSKNYRIVSSEVLVGVALVGLVLVALAVIITVIAAAFYNLFAELVGGIEVTAVDDSVSTGW